jgi:mono/diheme cytochrome c family protein
MQVPLVVCSAAIGLIAARNVDAAEPVRAVAPIEYARDVRPILADSCFACHGPDRAGQENDLRLDQPIAASDDAPILPGRADESELIRRITSDDPAERMPPVESNRKPLSDQQIAVLRQWIDQGASYSQHWAYQVPVRPEVPAVHDSSWPINAIDRFVLAQNESRDVAQSGPATARTLVRRLSFDLLGLPPDPETAEAFLADPSPTAYASLVDQTLESQHFGQRLAVLWLDLVRFADTCGYHGDQHREIDAYRDYVIDSFNKNKPFDQFTTEQLAGDLMPGATPEQLVASGYNRLLQTTEEGGAQAKEYRAIYDADRVRNVTTVWLGSTVGCAQCHDHKFDPFSTSDFYRLAAFFADIAEVEVGRQTANLELPTDQQRARIEAFDAELKLIKARTASDAVATDQSASGTSNDAGSSSEANARIKQLERQREQLSQSIRRTLVAQAIQPRVTRVLARGNWQDESGPIVEPAIPAVFGSLAVAGDRATRLDLARWIVSPDNPLTARVFVNHLWRTMFGFGLVRTPDDFGSQGQYPTHPELLDWLAVEFRESGWDIKHMLRLMAMSSTYRQSSDTAAELRQRDPYNQWLARQQRFRLDAEWIRDTALAVSGLLNPTVGGPSVKPYQPAGYWDQLNFPKRTYQADTGGNQYRRGVYTYWCRTFLHPSLLAFDAPTREECTARRPRSNTPLQALVLLNDPSYVEAARALAQRIVNIEPPSDDDRVAWAFREVLTRPPTDAEREVMRRLLADQRDRYRQDPLAAAQLVRTGQWSSPDLNDVQMVELAAWTSFGRVLLNLHETITRE